MSFAGFTNGEIFCRANWHIKPKTSSTTISVARNCINDVLYHIELIHGAPVDKGTKGLMFRSSAPSATITVYTSTSTISVQGCQHSEWVDTVLPEIELKMDLLKSSDLQLSTCYDSIDDEDTSFPFTSTPRTSICLPTAVHTMSTGTQTVTPTHHDVACQTGCASQSSAETQTELCQVTDVCLQTKVCPCPTPEETRSDCTATNTRLAAGNHHVNTCPEPVNVCTTAQPTIDVPTIPTSNPFSVLDIEETTMPASESDESDDVPPIPLPWMTHSVSATKRPPKSKSNPDTTHATTHAQQPKSSECHNKSTSDRPRVRNTILILGDSMPKNLAGRRMSRSYRILNRCIPGTSLQIWSKLAPVLIEEEQPAAVIFHCGTNDIDRTLPLECLALLDSVIASISQVNSSTQIFISSLITQMSIGHAYWIQEYNARLRELCNLRYWTYIDNSNIEYCHLASDKLHLNGKGIVLLAQNFISEIKNLSSRKDFYVSHHNRTIK